MSFVYILTNEAMPGIVKIGRTKSRISQRMSALDTTGVPLPFQCYFAARVADDADVERMLHTAFGDHRLRRGREFFRLDPYRAKVVLEHIAIEDVTPRGDVGMDSEGKEAIEKVVVRTGRFNLQKYGIPVGAALEYSSDRQITCKVVDAENVEFHGEAVSLSRAAVLANKSRGGTATTAAGPLWWLFEGETLASIRERFEDGSS